MDFVHLHLHTEYSLLDGCCRIDRLMDAVKAAGQSAVAITDHGVMYGVIDFYKAAKSRGIKPVIGCEVYVAPRRRTDKVKELDSEYSHLVLLCENNEGYENLIKLVSAGFTEGFYSKPRVDRELLEKYHTGLIALSACLAGEIPRRLAASDYKAAYETALWYKKLFGENNYFLELQDHGIAVQKRINPLLCRLAKETGIGLVATNDVHYINADDFKLHKVLLCIQTGKKINEENPIEFPTNEFYLKTATQMAELFPDISAAIENSVKIAERCNVELEFGKIKLPRFDIGERDHAEFFRKKCYDGLYRNYGSQPDKAVTERLEYEISVIESMGYTDYYLIVWDFVRFAKSSGIPVGPGRGSGAGSLAAYCIGITGIDPMRYNLLFERFLNPERVSMPDFDIDFCYVNRQRVIDYVIDKYSSDHVAQIVTFGTMAARAAVRDVGRALDIPYNVCDKTAKLIPHSIGMTIENAIAEVPELKTAYDTDEQTKELIDTAMGLEGMPRHASTHAAGVVISDKPVSEYVPLALNDEAVVTQYTMTALDELGLLKMDFLGLRNLTVIDDTVKALKRESGIDVDIEKLPMDDAATYEMMSQGLTDGVFQFESDGMKSVLRQFVPTEIEDLIAIIALYRPGPMDSIPKYIHNHKHPEDISYPTPLLEPILKVTCGCIVYQEQVMQVCRSLAGYSYGRADIVRRAMAKKKKAVMEKEREAFVYGETAEDGSIVCEGAVRRGVPEETAQRVFDEMSAFSSYAFNKSHAAAYAVVAYRTAYLKCHYPAEYFAALLTSVLDSAGKITEYTAECRRMGIRILPPSVNESLEAFSAQGKEIRFGLLAVKNLGRGLISRIISERGTGGKYKSLYDFCKRNYSREFNRRALEGLIKSGALDGLEKNRRQMILSIEQVLSVIDDEKRFGGDNQMDIFGERDTPQLILTEIDEMPRRELLNMEREATGLYLSGHPMDGLQGFLKRGGYCPVGDITAGKYSDGKRVKIAGLLDAVKVRRLKNGNVLVSMTIEDMTDSVGVTVFSNAYHELRPLLTDGATVVMTGRVSDREDRDIEIICEGAQPVPDSAYKIKPPAKYAPGLYLKISNTENSSFESVKALLSEFHGEFPVIIYCTDTGKKLRAPDSMRCSGDSALLSRLSALLGEENVRLVSGED